MKKVFLDDIPMYTEGKNKGKINWGESVGYKVYFIYDDIEDYLSIINCIKEKDKQSKLTIEYNNEQINISTGHFSQCKIGKLLNKKTNNFKVEIKTVFKDDKRNLLILDREYRKNKYGQNCKYYKYKCLKCGNEDYIIESLLLNRKIGCNACCNQKVTENNCIYTIDKNKDWKYKYGISEKDSKMYTCGSNKKIIIKCPLCNREKKMDISRIYSKKSISCVCGDNISYPEKFTMSLLNQLNIKYITQLSKSNFEWCDKYRYDFYFEYNNEQYIIETHGEQHYINSFKMLNSKTLEEEQKNDKYKKKLALHNNIKENNYIILDCRESNLKWIGNSIVNSKLNKLFDITDDMLIRCEKFTLDNLVKQVCDYWKLHNDINGEGLTTTNLGGIFELNRHTIRVYLEQGYELHWCNYNPKNEIMNRIKRISKQVEIFKDGKSLGVFSSCMELSRQSEELFNIKLLKHGIIQVALGNKSKYKGFTFKYV